MKAVSLPDTAYEILKGSSDPMTFKELYKRVTEKASMSPEEASRNIGIFYTDLTLEARFVGLQDNKWDLRERRSFAEVEKKNFDAYTAEFEDQSDEDKADEEEYDKAMAGSVLDQTGEDTNDGQGYEGEEGNKESSDTYGYDL